VADPTKTTPIDNPLHQFPTWTYSFSLWWLDVADYNNLVNARSPGAGATALLPNSYVLAEDGGVYANKRLPSTAGLNYYITEVEMENTIGLNATSKSGNITHGKMIIVEPYGISLVDTLLSASFDPATGTFKNYQDRPYMLQVDFTGFDEKGNPIPVSTSKLYRKRFPIRLLQMKIELTDKGTQYTISFSASGHEAYDQGAIATPKIFTVQASTVKEFFDDLTKQWNAALIYLVEVKKTQTYASRLKFAFPFSDPKDDIASSKLITSNNTPLSEINSTKTTLDVNSKKFTIPAGTNLVDILFKVLAQSQWMQDQLGLLGKDPSKTDQSQLLNTFKIQTLLEYKGFKSTAEILSTDPNAGTVDAFDPVLGNRAKDITFIIKKFTSFNTNHPRTTQLKDSYDYTVKNYQYIYTGQNKDIVELKMNFDSTFFVPVLSFTNQFASQLPTGVTLKDILATNSPDILLTQGFVSQLFPQLGTIGNDTPMKYLPQVNRPTLTQGFTNIANPAAQVGLDVMSSLYTRLNGDMLYVEMRIVGDPTLLKQDDWLYVSPNSGAETDASLSQADFCNKYGFIRMDDGDVVCRLTINSPLDNDIDISNQGNIYPPPGTRPSTFDGQYRILTVKSNFANGKFEQVIRMTRYSNSKLMDAFRKYQKSLVDSARDPVNTNNNNTIKTGGTNISSTTNTPTVVPNQPTIAIVNNATNASTSNLLGTQQLTPQLSLVPTSLQLTTGPSAAGTDGVGVNART